MLRLKEGDAVSIVDRPSTAADSRSGLYYGYYRNLMGKVFKLYGSGDTQQAAIDVDLESLPEEVAQRHREATQQMRASLPGGVKRNNASASESFQLRYIVLVAVTDLARRRAKA